MKVSPIPQLFMKATLRLITSVIPIVCEPTDTNAYIKLVATLDVVVETLNGDLNGTSALVLNAVSTASRTLRPASASKITYIYTVNLVLFLARPLANKCLVRYMGSW